MAMTSTDRGGANSRRSIGVLLFDEFELLDVFGRRKFRPDSKQAGTKIHS